MKVARFGLRMPKKEVVLFLLALILALASQSNLAIIAIALAVPLYRFYFGEAA